MSSKLKPTEKLLSTGQRALKTYGASICPVAPEPGWVVGNVHGGHMGSTSSGKAAEIPSSPASPSRCANLTRHPDGWQRAMQMVVRYVGQEGRDTSDPHDFAASWGPKMNCCLLKTNISGTEIEENNMTWTECITVYFGRFTMGNKYFIKCITCSRKLKRMILWNKIFGDNILRHKRSLCNGRNELRRQVMFLQH